VDEIADIWPEPESQLLRLVFFTEEQYQRYLTLLTAGVPWAACNGALVYGWAPSDAVTAVRLTGVPANLPEAAIRAHFAQFGCVTRVFRSKDKVFTRACMGIVRISIAVAPGFALPAFVSFSYLRHLFKYIGTQFPPPSSLLYGKMGSITLFFFKWEY
jgi:hypothetical protein